MSRRPSIIELDQQLSDRDRELVRLVDDFRYLSGRQLERLCFNGSTDETRARLARHSLAKLTDAGLLSRIARRIGGVRAGSAGYVYALGPAGRALASYWAGDGIARPRTAHEPGGTFVRHLLGIGEALVQLREAERAGRLDLLAFAPEPDSWRRYSGAAGTALTLKADAFARIGVGAYEDRYFIEIDCGTEGRGALMRQCRAYVDYWRSGAEQAEHKVFPKVLWVTTTARRVALITSVYRTLPADAHQLFAVTTPDRAVDLIACGLGEAA